MPKEITGRQKELLQFIVRQIREHNLPPSISEMASFLKVSSKNAVAKLLNALEEAGYVKTDGRARGITVLESLGETLEKGLVRVPLLGRIQAGSPHMAEEQIEEWVNLPQTLVKGRRDVFLLKVKMQKIISKQK
jgi:repressor LexA